MFAFLNSHSDSSVIGVEQHKRKADAVEQQVAQAAPVFCAISRIPLCSLPEPALERIGSWVNIPRAVCRCLFELSVRLSRAKIAAALATAAQLPNNSSTAHSIERALYSACSSSNGARYKQKARVLLFNLKKNSELRERVASGELSSDQLVRLDAKGLASSALQKERVAAVKQGMQDITRAQHASETHTVTDR
jgi:Transcription factor S-II (TFIIS), central domain